MSDEETVEAITENPYLQYFTGLHSFQEAAPFHASSMTQFRKRFDLAFINQLNESVVLEQRKKDKQDKRDYDDERPNGDRHTYDELAPSSSKEADLHPNQGKLLLDATCAPAEGE